MNLSLVIKSKNATRTSTFCSPLLDKQVGQDNQQHIVEFRMFMHRHPDEVGSLMQEPVSPGPSFVPIVHNDGGDDLWVHSEAIFGYDPDVPVIFYFSFCEFLL